MRPAEKGRTLEFRVPFHDCDPMQVMWHGHYFKYFDQARDALFESLGVDLYAFFRRTGYLFPIVRTATKHIHPLRHQDVFTCRAAVLQADSKLVVDFEIRLADGRLCARGKTEQVAVKTPEMEMSFLLPAEIRERLADQAAPAPGSGDPSPP